MICKTYWKHLFGLLWCVGLASIAQAQDNDDQRTAFAMALSGGLLPHPPALEAQELEFETIMSQLHLLEIRVADLKTSLIPSRFSAGHVHGPLCGHGNYHDSPYARLAAGQNSTASVEARITSLMREIDLLGRLVSIREVRNSR